MMITKNLGGRPRTLKAKTPYDAALGGIIRRRRELAGISPEKLGDRIGKSADQVYRYEAGVTAVKPEILAKIAGAIGCKSQDFLDGVRVKP